MKTVEGDTGDVWNGGSIGGAEEVGVWGAPPAGVDSGDDDMDMDGAGADAEGLADGSRSTAK